MHNGVIPGAFTANSVGSIPNLRRSGQDDMKSQNKKNSPGRRSFIDWLQYRAQAEDEELDDINLDDEEQSDEESNDWDNEDFDTLEYEDGDNEECDDCDDDDPEEFDDFDEEKELSFDDEELDSFVGHFADFYRMDDEEDGDEEDDEEYEEEEEGPGGFTPGQAKHRSPTRASGTRQSAKSRAKILFQQLMNRPDISRDEIIQEFTSTLDVTEETAITYYEDLAKEFGFNQDSGDVEAGSQMGDKEEPVADLPADTEMELSQEEVDDQEPNAQGIIRTVANAHLVYKRQMEDGSFEELWVYNLGDGINDALEIRRDILNGTDIPRGHTRSENGQQAYSLQTMGNAQLLHLTGLSN